MACERCGGERGPLPGMGCFCPTPPPEPSWISKALVATTVGMLMFGVGGTLILLLTPEERRAEPVAGGDVDELPDFPGRVNPSVALPLESPSPAPSTATSSTRSPSATSGPRPTDADSGRPKPPAGPGGTYTLWAGHGCTTGNYWETGRYGGGYGVYDQGGHGGGHHGDDGYGDGYGGDRYGGWYDLPYGGHRNAFCDGSFAAVPMSGSADQDGGNAATWAWNIGERYRSCSIAVRVPDSGDPSDTAGDPTHYQVLADPFDVRSGYDSFRIRQTVHRGELVDAGTYPVRDGRIAVRLTDRGDTRGGHHGAAQMRATCHTS